MDDNNEYRERVFQNINRMNLTDNRLSRIHDLES